MEMEYIYLYRACNFLRNFATTGHLHDGVIVLTTTTTRILQSFVFSCHFGLLLFKFGINKFKYEKENELNNDLSAKKKPSRTKMDY